MVKQGEGVQAVFPLQQELLVFNSSNHSEVEPSLHTQNRRQIIGNNRPWARVRSQHSTVLKYHRFHLTGVWTQNTVQDALNVNDVATFYFPQSVAWGSPQRRTPHHGVGGTHPNRFTVSFGADLRKEKFNTLFKSAEVPHHFLQMAAKLFKSFLICNGDRIWHLVRRILPGRLEHFITAY